MKNCWLIWGNLVSVLFYPSSTLAEDEQVKQIYVVVQDELTPYGLMGYYFQAELKERNLVYKINESKGSFEALLELEKSTKGSIAIVQADVLYHYLHGGHPLFPLAKKSSRVRGVARLFPEWLFIEHYGDPAEHKSAEIVLRTTPTAHADKLGSGTLVTAINVGRTLQTRWNGNLSVPIGSPKKPSLRFRVRSPYGLQNFNNESTLSTELIFPPKSALLPLASAYSSTYQLKEKRDITSKIGISAEKLDDDAATISVDAILVCTADTSTKSVMAIQEIIMDLDSYIQNNEKITSTNEIQIPQKTEVIDPSNNIRVEAKHIRAFTSYSDYTQKKINGGVINIDAMDRSKYIPVSVHPLIRLKRNSDERPEWDILSPFLVWLHSISPLLFILAIAVILIITWCIVMFIFVKLIIVGVEKFLARINPRARWIFQVQSSSRLSRWTLVGVAFVISHFLVGTAVWISEYFAETLEPESTVAVGGMFVATWEMVQMVVIGVTPKLRSELSVWWIALLKSGYAVTTLLITVSVARKITNWTQIMDYKDHVVVIGWNMRGLTLIEELKSQGRDFVIVAKRKTDESDDSLSTLEDTKQNAIKQIKSELNDDVLGYAKVTSARAVIILADEITAHRNGDQDVDLWVLKTISKVSKSINGKPIYIIAEIRNPENAQFAKSNGADEALCINTFGTELLAHAAKTPELVTIFGDLLKTSDDTNEVYLEEVPDNWAGKKFGEIMQYRLSPHRHDKTPLVIGVLPHKTKKPKVNPTYDFLLDKSDLLIVLNYQKIQDNSHPTTNTTNHVKPIHGTKVKKKKKRGKRKKS